MAAADNVRELECDHTKHGQLGKDRLRMLHVCAFLKGAFQKYYNSKILIIVFI